MTTTEPLAYEPGMSLADFQRMIADRDPKARPAPATAAPPPIPELTPTAAKFAKLREKLDNARRDVVRLKNRLATANRRVEQLTAELAQLRAEKRAAGCTHPFAAAGVTVSAGRHTKGIAIRIRFTCPDCGEQFADIPKLIRA